jgi:hypothetical protein
VASVAKDRADRHNQIREKNMQTTLKMAALFLLAAPIVAHADDAKQVLDRHVAGMKKGDLEAVMADYADNAVVITPHGIAPGQKAASSVDVFPGKANARKLFSVLTDKDHVGGNRSMKTRYEDRGNDVTAMYWRQNQGTPQDVSGVDIFVIRDGKIAFQDVTVDATPH